MNWALSHIANKETIEVYYPKKYLRLFDWGWKHIMDYSAYFNVLSSSPVAKENQFPFVELRPVRIDYHSTVGQTMKQ